MGNKKTLTYTELEMKVNSLNIASIYVKKNEHIHYVMNRRYIFMYTSKKLLIIELNLDYFLLFL